MALTVEKVCDGKVPRGAKVLLFGKHYDLLSVIHVVGKTYSVTIPSDIEGGSNIIAVSAEHEVLTNVKEPTVEEVAKAAEEAAVKLKVEEEARKKEVREKSEASAHKPPGPLVGGTHVPPKNTPDTPVKPEAK